MPIQINCSVTPFTGQKGRKLLVPVQISAFGATGITSDCRLRVSKIGQLPDALTLQVIPGTWDGTDNSVVSPSFSPPSGSLDFTVFCAFFDDIGPTTPDTYNGAFRIEVVDASQTNLIAFLDFQLAGSAAPAQSVDVVFVLDHSWSMATTDSSNVNRLSRLKTAFSRAIALFRPDDTLGVATFDNVRGPATAQLAPALATSTQRGAAASLANSLVLDLASPTVKAIQMGIDAGRALSQTATLVLLTDGVNANVPGHVLTQPTLPTSALIIGENPAAIPASAATMTSATGHYAFASELTLGEFAIEKLLTQLLIGIGGSTFITDPEGSLRPGESQSFPLHVTETDRDVQVIVFSNDAGALDVRLDLERNPPHSEQQRQDSFFAVQQHPGSAQVVRDEGVLIVRPTIPALSHPERTSLNVTVSRTRAALDEGAPVRFNLIVAAKTDLALDTNVATCGSDLQLAATLLEYGQIWDRPDTKMQVELFYPDGRMQTLELNESAPGRFQASVRNLEAGAYTAHFIATGRSLLDKRVFQRECLRSVALLPSS